MPLACVIKGWMEEDSKVCPRSLHATLLSMFEKVNPDLSKALHESAAQKAFTLSPLFNSRSGAWFRVTLLDDNLSSAFLSYFLEGHISKINLGSGCLKVKEIKASRNSWSGYIDYKSLWRNNSLDREITFEFHSPTAFRQGDLDLPLPVPRLVFQSYYGKWKVFSDTELMPDLLEAIESNVGVAKFQGRTVPFEDGRVTIPGFVGKVTYMVKNSVNEEALHQINLLADYAFFAGTGRKTTHGMGMTRRVR